MASEGDGKGGFSLSLGARKVRRLDIHGRADGATREAVARVGASGVELVDKPPERALPVIARQENTFRAGRRPSFLPPAQKSAAEEVAEGVSRFEAAGGDGAEVQALTVAYGLNVRGRRAAEAGSSRAGGSGSIEVKTEEGNDEGEGGGAGGAATSRGGARSVGPAAGAPPQRPAPRDLEAESLASHLETLPPVASLDAYEAMPVEHFGRALLVGMGWKEGTAIGGKRQEVAAAVPARRPARLGLGADPAPVSKAELERARRRPAVPGEAARGAGEDGKSGHGHHHHHRHHHHGRPQAAAVPRYGAHPGKIMRVVGGRHEGLRCEVLRLEPREEGRSLRASVRLLPADIELVVRAADLEDIGDGGGRRGDAEHPGPSDRGRVESDSGREPRHGRQGRPEEEWRPTAGGDEPHEAPSRDAAGRARMRGAAPHGLAGARRPPPVTPATSWVVPGIRVRVVSKSLAGGAHYLRKGVVRDVKAPGLCDVRLDEDERRRPADAHDVRQDQLETVVPRIEGGRIKVVLGGFKGRGGRLLRRSSKDGVAAVALDGRARVEAIDLDSLAEVIFEPHEGDS